MPPVASRLPAAADDIHAPLAFDDDLFAGMTPAAAAPPAAAPRPGGLLDVGLIYLEPAVEGFARGREILASFPHAERRVVPSHWNIPGLHGDAGMAEEWLRVKRTTLVLGVRKSFTCRPNGRSADFIAPGAASGCAMACAYCYVPRRKGFANPITTFVNVEALLGHLERHARRQGPKSTPNQVDSARWVYDIGENSDCSVDALLSANVADLIGLFARLPHAKASFATKFVNRDLLAYEPRGATRVRFSLMPAAVARVVDVRTSPIPERLAAINDFVAAGYEVHLNFSPVILYEGWTRDYAELFEQVADALSPAARAQVAAEVIFLTHHAGLHEVNLSWHPRAEELLWQPRWQETKTSENGGENVRYRHGIKGKLVARFRALLAERLPFCPVRYAF